MSTAIVKIKEGVQGRRCCTKVYVQSDSLYSVNDALQSSTAIEETIGSTSALNAL